MEKGVEKLYLVIMEDGRRFITYGAFTAEAEERAIVQTMNTAGSKLSLHVRSATPLKEEAYALR